MFFVCCLLCISISACSLFESSSSNESSNNGSGGSSTSTTYSVKVVYDDESLNFNFTSTSAISITPRYKSGYVLEGYYTQSGGNGELMLDYLGQSASSNWAQSKTTVVYPYYTEINYDYVYTYSMIREEEPYEFHYNIYGATYASFYLTYEKSSYIYKVCVGNPKIKVKIIGYADIRATANTSGSLHLALSSKSDNSSQRSGELKKTAVSFTKDFKTYSISLEMTASAIVSSKNKYLGVGFFGDGSIISYATCYVKNIYWTMSIVQ